MELLHTNLRKMERIEQRHAVRVRIWAASLFEVGIHPSVSGERSGAASAQGGLEGSERIDVRGEWDSARSICGH